MYNVTTISTVPSKPLSKEPLRWRRG